ncbi:single-stranded DNA-binding protein [Phycisphaerales bacterium AB-hyl4]|uniref:Single-stranded DNA-binding protein n=1 Tax=Natronomicrosphaera hydrolytica TaxID=3242702 RepID=A0ABV4U1S5_9BACT
MPNLNKVMLMGNLTRDPEMRYTANNTPVTKLGLAVNRRWKNQQGEQQEETCFIDCTAFARGAEVLNQYLRKGRPVFIEGRLHLNQWQDQQGNNRSKLEVIVENFQFIDSRGGEGGGGGGDYGGGGGGGYQSGGGGGGGPQQRSQGGGGQPPQQPHQPVDADDIPF